MRALLFLDRGGAGLGPLVERAPVALLPIAGRPVAFYAIEALAAAGIADVTAVVSQSPEAIEAMLGNGERWGLRLDYVLTRGDESPREVVRRLGARIEGPLLLVRGDVLVHFDLRAFIDRARERGADAVHATIDAMPTGVVWASSAAALDDLAFVIPERPDTPESWRASGAAIDSGPGLFALLESLRAFHTSSLGLLDQRPPGLEIPGREVAVGVRVGRHARVPLRAVHDQPVLAGARAEVDPRAELLDHVMLADDVVVDRGATLRRTVVLPGTYIGELVELQDAIVWSNLLVRVDTGAVARVTDAFLLADLRRETFASTLESVVHRALGAALLVLSLPLWPILLALSLAVSPRAPFSRVTLCGNRTRADRALGTRTRMFRMIVPATHVRWLRSLPGLLAVVSADLRLVGVKPLTPAENDARSEEWELVRDEAPAGWLAPSEIAIPDGAPHEERLMMDAFYARTRTPARDAAWFLRGLGALFTRRAWMIPAAQ